MKRLKSLMAAVLCVALAMPAAALAQQPPAVSPPPAVETKSFSQAELDQLVAPIALYPDALLAQVLMASTYPIEVVYADRWIAANPSLKGTALENALQSQTWEPAVKSLTVFPQVLQMMSQKLDWTQKLGDAFLAQQQEVMATVQALRAKALAEGTLKDSREQKVIVVTENNVTVIKIEPADPEVVYVPTYDPSIVYGTWPYPAYPPYYWYPPGYYPGGGFAAGIIIGWALWATATGVAAGVVAASTSTTASTTTSIALTFPVTTTGDTTSTIAAAFRTATSESRSSTGADPQAMRLRARRFVAVPMPVASRSSAARLRSTPAAARKPVTSAIAAPRAWARRAVEAVSVAAAWAAADAAVAGADARTEPR
jgi:hypothetical protein